MDVVVVNEGRRYGDERDIAGKAAVVVPVVSYRGNAILQAGCVDADDNEIGAWMNDRGEFTIKRVNPPSWSQTRFWFTQTWER